MSLFSFKQREGKGVDENAPKLHPFFQFFPLFFRKFPHFIALNLIYIICIIPIFTFGPATAGLTYVMRCFATQKPCFPYSDFFSKFKENFKQTVFVGILDFVLLYLTVFSYLFYIVDGQFVQNILFTVITAIMMFVYLIIRQYFYVMVVTFELDVQSIIRNCFLFIFLGFLHNIVMLLFSFGLFIAALHVAYMPTLLIFPLIGFSLLTFISVYTIYPIINKHMIEVAKASE